jgi:rhodanese-related sulfurtransferase
MSAKECNYEIYDCEMLGLIHALKDWQHFLEGLPKPFEVVTDHKNMEWWVSMCDLTHRQARWALYLSRFHFVIKYKKGSQMQADALSQSAIGGKFLDAVDNRQVTVLKPEQFIAAATIHFKPDDDSLIKCICHLSAREAKVLEGLRALGKSSPCALTEGIASWEEEDGLVYFKGRLYVPNECTLHREVLQTCHDNLTAGHPGKNGTLNVTVPRDHGSK